MKPEDYTLVCIYDEKHEVWCVHPQQEPFSHLMVQVDDLKDAPKQLAACFEAMCEMAFKKDLLIKEAYKPAT